MIFSGTLITSLGLSFSYTQWLWLTTYFALLAGGKDPASNDQSHQENLSSLISTLEHHSVPAERGTIFWADGDSPEADRRLPSPKRESLFWVVEDTPWQGWFERETLLANTRWDKNYKTYPARRDSIRQWLKSLAAELKPNDSLVIAVTDHGYPDPQGAWRSSNP